MTKKEKQYIKDVCRDEIEAARELRKKARQEGKKTAILTAWIKKHQKILETLKEQSTT